MKRVNSAWPVVAITLALALTTEPATAQKAPSPSKILRALSKAQLADGIDDNGYVQIGGIRQWISVKGRHKDAPILLFLHGGPALSSIPTSWLFFSPWEEYFTVVQWDQRGTGKTYEANAPAEVAPTMILPQALQDAEDVVTYLRRTYKRRKIILIGYSWGSVLGVMLAQRHPDWFYAYVGMGQFVDYSENERRGYAQTLSAARRAGDRQAIAALEAMSPFPDPSRPDRNLANLAQERHWLEKYRGAVWHGEVATYDDVARLSPDYDENDLKARDEGQTFSFKYFWPILEKIGFRRDNNFSLPVIFVHGVHDTNVSASLLQEWFRTIHAPSKRLVWFQDSGHYLDEEEPGKMLVTLVQDVLPLARPHRRAS